jgi:hypothetical protein
MSIVETSTVLAAREKSASRFTISPIFLRRRRLIALLMQGILFAAAAVSVLVTAGIVYVLLSESVRFFAEVSIIDFLTDTQWTPVFENPRFGIMTLVSGTLVSSLIALVVAMPSSSRASSCWPACRRSHSVISPFCSQRRSFKCSFPPCRASTCSCRASSWES